MSTCLQENPAAAEILTEGLPTAAVCVLPDSEKGQLQLRSLTAMLPLLPPTALMLVSTFLWHSSRSISPVSEHMRVSATSRHPHQ